MRTTLVSLALLLALPHLNAAPAPEPGRGAKEKLEALKKRLPDVVAAWARERWDDSRKVEVRMVRLLGPARAKVVIVSLGVDPQGRRRPVDDTAYTILLDFYDGVWSTTGVVGLPTDGGLRATPSAS
jgi:hypothetical protein